MNNRTGRRSRTWTQLCEYELAERYQRRVRLWTREARLPAGKTFASLQLEHLAKSARQPVQQIMADLDWWQRAENVILVGASGVGKTHIAAALGTSIDRTTSALQTVPGNGTG